MESNQLVDILDFHLDYGMGNSQLIDDNSFD
jgi:hypothetical protein